MVYRYEFIIVFHNLIELTGGLFFTMYEYRFYITTSTKPANIYDDDKNLIGILTKVYSNLFKRILDLYPFGGRAFAEYKLSNEKEQLVFKSKRGNPFKRRQYYVYYYKNEEERYIQLIDKKSFDIGERTTFEYNGETYQLEKEMMEWARIKKNGSTVAEWNPSLKPPFKAYFKLLDEEYEDDILLLIGIFHTYLHAA